MGITIFAASLFGLFLLTVFCRRVGRLRGWWSDSEAMQRKRRAIMQVILQEDDADALDHHEVRSARLAAVYLPPLTTSLLQEWGGEMTLRYRSASFEEMSGSGRSPSPPRSPRTGSLTPHVTKVRGSGMHEPGAFAINLEGVGAAADAHDFEGVPTSREQSCRSSAREPSRTHRRVPSDPPSRASHRRVPSDPLDLVGSLAEPSKGRRVIQSPGSLGAYLDDSMVAPATRDDRGRRTETELSTPRGPITTPGQTPRISSLVQSTPIALGGTSRGGSPVTERSVFGPPSAARTGKGHRRSHSGGKPRSFVGAALNAGDEMIHRVENGDFRKRSLSKREAPEGGMHRQRSHSTLSVPGKTHSIVVAMDRSRRESDAFVDDFGALAGTKHDDREASHGDPAPRLEREQSSC